MKNRLEMNQIFQNISRIVYNQNRNEEAIQYYDKVIFIRPDFQKAYCNNGVVLTVLNRSRILHKQNRYDKEIECYDKAQSTKQKLDFSIEQLNQNK